jgi:hypothetical protein
LKDKTASLKARAFLAAFRLTGSITEAALAAKIDRTMHYRWLKSPSYEQAFKKAQLEAGDMLEDIAVRRVREGPLDPIFYQGEKVGARRVYDSGLMQFLLRGLKPQKYSSKTELTGADGGPIEIVERLNAARARINPENLEAEQREAAQKAGKPK